VKAARRGGKCKATVPKDPAPTIAKILTVDFAELETYGSVSPAQRGSVAPSRQSSASTKTDTKDESILLQQQQSVDTSTPPTVEQDGESNDSDTDIESGI